MNGLRLCVLAAAVLTCLALLACGGESRSESTVTVTKTETVERDQPGPADPELRSNDTPLADYTSSLYTARVPADWKFEKDEVASGDFVRSQWRHPSDPNTSVLIDAVEGEVESPAEKAQAVRDATSTTSGYQEVSFGPTTLQGLDAYRWAFAVSGDKRVDYFMNECDVGVAILGSTSPSTFSRHSRLFRRVARSVQTDCADNPPPDDSPPPPPEESCEDGYDPCVPPYSEGDVDCADVGGPVSVTGSDPHGLDADGDGTGCE